jgi:hypothetical protein
MHVIFGVTGIQQNVEIFEKYFQSIPFNMNGVTKDGRNVPIVMQGQLRPIRLYDFSFPKEYRDAVLNTLYLYPKKDLSFTNASLSTLPFTALRKFLKLEPIPKTDSDVSLLGKNLFLRDMHTIGIGIREDRNMDLDINLGNGVTEKVNIEAL